MLPLRPPETCCWPSKDCHSRGHSRSRRYAAEARATTSKPWISFSRYVKPDYQAKNSYLTVHATYDTVIPTRISMAISARVVYTPSWWLRWPKRAIPSFPYGRTSILPSALPPYVHPQLFAHAQSMHSHAKSVHKRQAAPD